MSPHHAISRRRAIALGGLGAAAAAGVSTRIADGDAPPRAPGGTDRPDSGDDLRQPALLDSDHGRLEVELTAAAGVRLAGRDTRALGYNAVSPGPTLRVRPGDELAVRLTNHLDQPTNLHTHGLRVSPQANGDNPFVRVDPGTSFDYLIRVPDDHPSGTFWYHPHHHGMVTDQIFGGLAGALLVEPRPGHAPDLGGATEQVMVFTDITLTDDGRVAAPSAMDRNMGRQGEWVLINGQRQPTIPVDGTQRWRMINACVSRVLVIRLQGHPLLQIAHDGAFFGEPAAKDQVVLGPGNRADVLVRPSAPGRYALTAEPFQRGSMDGKPIVSDFAALATVAVSQPSAMPPPGPLPVDTLPDGPAVTRRQIAFQMRMGAGGGPATFLIDGRTFDPDRDDQTPALGAIEEWTITNTTQMAHPFHLHVWPFTVLASSDGTPPLGVAQDVVLVPAQGWVRLRIPFTRFAGRTVYHCHILDHEDLGMMATVNVGG